MSDPALAVQQALVAALKAAPAMAAIVAGRVYDAPPAAATYPYVSVGEDVLRPDPGDGYDGSDLTVTLHLWSRATGFPETKRLAAAVRATMTDALDLGPAHRLVNLYLEEVRYLRDPDGATSHGVLTYTVSTEPT